MSGTGADPGISPERFRAAMGRWATGVSVVTAHAGGTDAGLTVNALLSVSLEPPSVLVSLQRDVDTLPVLREGQGFGVSFLAAGQRALSLAFARAVPSEEKFRSVAFHRGRRGVALLDGALATLECRLVSEHAAFDHVLVLGEVERLEEGPPDLPLLFFRGRYGEVEGADRLRLGARGP